MFYRSLTAAYADILPAATLNRLADPYRINVMRSLTMTAELLRLPELLEAHGIWSLPFKGPVLPAAIRGRMLSSQHRALGHVERGFSHLRTMESAPDKTLYCLGPQHESLTPNSTDRSVVPLPKFLHALYYLIHPVPLTLTHGPSPLKHLVKRAS